MSDIMRPIPFSQLMNWIIEEHKTQGAVFGVRKMVTTNQEGALPIFDERIETPFGPAAGPNTQLAQNIVASYVAGSRFFELKTVQVMDGEELSKCVNKPCIVAQDECYNCELSTELEVPQAFAEYVKAWFACHLSAREYGLGSPDGFVFNMSVGYDLEGIKGEKVNTYIDGMMDASRTAIFGECKEVLKELFLKMNIKLVDFKIEFGKTSDGEIVLADEVSPDTCRLWDMSTNEKLDKDRFRRDLGKVREAYEEILARLQKIVE